MTKVIRRCAAPTSMNTSGRSSGTFTQVQSQSVETVAAAAVASPPEPA
ncbi:MAG: hypothetical protein QM783_19380 [Phycisphaerales bacterium]